MKLCLFKKAKGKLYLFFLRFTSFFVEIESRVVGIWESGIYCNSTCLSRGRKSFRRDDMNKKIFHWKHFCAIWELMFVCDGRVASVVSIIFTSRIDLTISHPNNTLKKVLWLFQNIFFLMEGIFLFIDEQISVFSVK